MAVAFVTLDTENQRVKWFKTMIRSLERDSRFATLEGKGAGGGTVIRESVEKAGHTFYVETVGVLSGAPIGFDTALVDNTTSLNFSAVTGYRASWAQAVAARRYTQADTVRAFRPETIGALRKHWARMYDALLVDQLSAYNTDLSTTRTTAQLAKIYDPSLSTNMTAFKLIANLANVGTADVASSDGVSMFYAGEDTESGGGPRTRPPVNTWNAALANPEAFLIDERSIGYLYDYVWNRGIPPIDLESDFLGRPPYILMLPSAAISQLRLSSAYRNAVVAGDIRATEMWTGKMGGAQNFDTLHGIVLMPFDNPYPFSVNGVTRNTLLRNEAADGDAPWTIYEALLLGAQAGGVDSYDDNFQIREANENDFERTPKIGYDIIKGAVKNGRVDTNTSTPVIYYNVASFCFASRKW